MSLNVGIIPARYASTRFPGKPLKLLRGLPVIAHVCAAAARVRNLSAVYVATDDERIAEAVIACGHTPIMTRSDHVCGTDRIVEALSKLETAPDIVVNIQGDEPLIDPLSVEKAVDKLENSDADWSTLVYPISAEEAANPNKVKVVLGTDDRALYFSRAAIPYPRDGVKAAYFGHIGLYCYKREALMRFASADPTPLEMTEKLEQLRALENGMKIVCVKVDGAAPGIDTPEDLAKTEEILRKRGEM
ncbi:3-deoxy-manno-octulosonate cytidylyltransferase [bacterium]|nr:3-deoxy-manno-octulosonate cytidylyltransferase [bacterium]